MNSFCISTYLLLFIGSQHTEMTRSAILNVLLEPLLKAYKLTNQFGKEFAFDEAFASRLITGQLNVPSKISLAATRYLQAPPKGQNAYRLFTKIHPFVNPESTASLIQKAINVSEFISVNEKKKLASLFPNDLPAFFERALFLSLLFDNRRPDQRTKRPRGRPAKVDVHPDYETLSGDERKARARLFLLRLNRKKESITSDDFQEFLAILRFEAYPFGPKSRERILKSILSSLPKKAAIEPLLAFELRFKKEIASFPLEGQEKASLFLPLIEPLGAELKFEELKKAREEAIAHGQEKQFLELARKTAGAFYWRKSSPTFRSLLERASFLDDSRLDEGTRKALGEAFAPLKG